MDVSLQVKIAMVGKYTGLSDSYLSVLKVVFKIDLNVLFAVYYLKKLCFIHIQTNIAADQNVIIAESVFQHSFTYPASFIQTLVIWIQEFSTEFDFLWVWSGIATCMHCMLKEVSVGVGCRHRSRGSC